MLHWHWVLLSLLRIGHMVRANSIGRKTHSA
jgi:hypothetical protein